MKDQLTAFFLVLVTYTNVESFLKLLETSGTLVRLDRLESNRPYPAGCHLAPRFEVFPGPSGAVRIGGCSYSRVYELASINEGPAQIVKSGPQPQREEA